MRKGWRMYERVRQAVDEDTADVDVLQCGDRDILIHGGGDLPRREDAARLLWQWRNDASTLPDVSLTRYMMRSTGRLIPTGYEEINPYSEKHGQHWNSQKADEPIQCPRCDGTLFECVREQWETRLRCLSCRIQFVVHEG